jgi:hypothetical protein
LEEEMVSENENGREEIINSDGQNDLDKIKDSDITDVNFLQKVN